MADSAAAPVKVESEDSASGIITLTVKSQRERESFQISPSDDVKALREMVAEKFSVEPGAVCLIFSGKILRDGGTIASHHLENGHIVHMVIRDARSAPQASTTTNTTTSSAPNSASTTASTPSSGNTTNPASDPFSSSAAGAGGAGSGMFDLFNSMMGNNLFGGAAAGADGSAAGAAGAFPNSEMLNQMLNNPMIEQMATNPELIQSIISNTPGFRDIMDRNPELGQMLRSPELFRQSLNLMRNPAAMQEMMRNRDRAMSNLESMPGGFNALRRMYTEMEEPMFQALSSRSPFESSNNAGNQNDNSTPNTTENRDPLPNPWDRSSSGNTASGGGTGAAAGGNRTGSFNPADLLGGANIQDMMRQLTSNPDAMRNIMGSMGMGGAGAGAGAGGLPNLANLGNLGNLGNMSSQMTLMQRIMGNPEAFQALMDIQNAHGRLERALGVSIFDLMSGNAPPLGASAGTTNTSTTATSGQTTDTNTTSAGGNTTNTASTGNNPSAPASNPLGAGNPNMFANMSQLMNMLGAMGGGAQGAGGQGGQPLQPPEERFASQLQQLEGMGFTNRERNIRALQQTFGNVEAAIEIILNGL